MKKIFISYAWATGCWKSPITNYISTKLWLPTFNTDAIRSEVTEDFLEFDVAEAKKRIKERLNLVIQQGNSFIYDASVDRTRWDLKEILIKNWYEFFIISIDLDKDMLLDFYKVKWYSESIKMIDKIYEDHERFLEQFWNDVNMHVNVENYKDRLENVYKKVSQRMNKFEAGKMVW